MSASSPDNSWTWTVEPFIWFAGLDGHGSADSSPPVDLGLTPSDVFGSFDAGFLLAVEARAPREPWTLMADGLYLRLADDEGTSHSTTQVTMIEAGSALSLSQSGQFELIAGLRYVDLGFDVDIGSAVDASAGATWVDPWIGARGAIELGDGWALRLRGDIGGFGVGSQFSWQAIAVIGAELGAGWRIDVGYRAISLDFSDNDLDYDALVYGGLLGIAWSS